MKRSRRCITRALTIFERVAGKRSVSTTSSMKCVKQLRPVKSICKTRVMKPREFFKKAPKPRIWASNHVNLVKFQSQFEHKVSSFKCYEESDVFCFSKEVRNKVKTLTEDFDIESDDETINNAVKCQAKKLLKAFVY